MYYLKLRSIGNSGFLSTKRRSHMDKSIQEHLGSLQLAEIQQLKNLAMVAPKISKPDRRKRVKVRDSHSADR